MTEKTTELQTDEVAKKEPSKAERRLSRRKALFGALLAGAAVKTAEAADANCNCLPAPNCDAVCPNGGAPRGDGTQACECFENPPMPTLATVAYTGKYGDLIDAPDPNQMGGAKLDDIVGAGSAGPGGDVYVDANNSGKVQIPYFTVNSQGRITSYATRTATIKATYYNYSNYREYRDYNCNDAE